MVFEVIEYSFSLMKRQPKILLPQVLSWIGTVIVSALVYFALLDLISMGANMQTFLFLINKYLGLFIGAFTISMLLMVYVQSIYVEIVKQAFSKKRIMLNEAFSAGWKAFFRLLWTNIVFVVLVLGIVVAVVALVLIGSAISPIVGTIFLLVAMIAGLAGIVYALPGLFLFSSVVVLEKASGLKAIRRSFRLSNGRKLSIWVIFILLGIFGIALSFIAYIPVIGIILTLPIYAITYTWSFVAPTVFYFRVEKKMKPKI
jgi:hypothetical protein